MSLMFVTWDGPRTNYLESLFLPQLARLGERVVVHQFSYASPEERVRAQWATQSWGMTYQFQSVFRLRPFAVSALSSLALGTSRLRRLAKDNAVDLILPRGVLPGLAAMGARSEGVQLVYEADGLVQDERVDFGGWSSRRINYRVMRSLEDQLLHSSRITITRTERSRQILLTRAGPDLHGDRIVAIPNGKDEELFCPLDPASRSRIRDRLGVEDDETLLVYCGSLGEQYRPHEMLAFFQALSARRRTKILVLTGSEGEARKIFGCSPNVIIERVKASEVPLRLAAADLALALRTPSFSQRAVCPIKVAEYLLCGLPCLISKDIGDLDEQLGDSPGVHFMPADGKAEDLARALSWSEQLLAQPTSTDAARRASREIGLKYFALSRTSELYRNAISRARQS
jgi:glycosyltransferase involved in cell wall biosynthesis